MNIGQIVAEITATTTGLRKAQQDANKQFGQIQNEATATSKIVKTAFAVAGTAAVLGFVAALAKATDGANETRKAMLGLESTSKAFGQNFEDANKSVKELYSDGLMPLDKSMRGFKNLLSVGFSVEEAMQISKSLKDIGAFNNVVGDLGQAYEDSTKGLKTGSMELIENIGLTQRLSTVMKNANVDISNGIDLTNNAAQRRAVYNAILAEGAKFEGNAAKLANDNAAANAKLSAAWKELSDNLGNRASPAFASVLELATQMTKAVSDFLKESNFSKVTKQLEEQQTQLYGLQTVYLQLKEKTSLTATEQEVYNETIKKLQDMFPDFLKNIDLQNIKYSDAVSVMQQLNSEMEKKILMEQSAAAIKDNSEKIVESFKKEKEAYDGLVIARGELKKAQDKYGTSFSAGNDVVYWAQMVDNKEKAIESEKRYRENLKNGIKYIQNYYSELLKMTDAKKKSFYVQPSNIYNTFDPDAKKFVPTATKTEKFKPDTSKTLAQKKKELEYKKQIDLANAKEEEKYLIELKYKTASAILDAEDKFNKAIAGAKTQKDVEKAYNTLIDSVGKLEVDEAVLKSKAEEAYKKFGKALGLLDINNYIQPENLELKVEVEAQVEGVNIDYSKMNEANAKYQDLTSPEQYMTTYAQQGGTSNGDNAAKTEQAFKDLDAALKNMIDVIDNDVINALYSLGEGGKSFINSFKGFQAGQTQGGLLGGLGMLTGGIGMFTSAVSIFKGVGGLFHKSTYNFDEAVKKMTEKIGDMTPEEQLAEVKKAKDIAQTGKGLGFSELRAGQIFTAEEVEKLKAAGAEFYEIRGAEGRVWALKRTTLEFLAAAKEVIPNLSEALGTSVEDFRQDFSSVLGDSANYSDMEDALYNAVFSSVKQGLINAYLLNEPMNKLTEKLRDTVTESVADGTLEAGEKAEIQKITEEVNQSLKPFIEGMEAVGLDLVGASDSLADATDNFSSTMNRNLKLAERISKDSLGNSQIINIDLAGANLGGMSEANIVNSLNKAVAMSNITKVGVR